MRLQGLWGALALLSEPSLPRGSGLMQLAPFGDIHLACKSSIVGSGRLLLDEQCRSGAGDEVLALSW